MDSLATLGRGSHRPIHRRKVKPTMSAVCLSQFHLFNVVDLRSAQLLSDKSENLFFFCLFLFFSIFLLLDDGKISIREVQQVIFWGYI